MSPADILIVDDTPPNIDLLTETLAHLPCRIRAATSGERALELAQRQPPDLILLDVMMAGLDGFETCRRLKADPRTAGVPVIFVTARHEDVSLGFAAGGADYIAKPIRAEEVRARVAHQIERRRLQLALEAANRDLELKVRERTAELVTANRHLRQEINERRYMQDRLNYLATHDFVTRLYNRNALDAQLSDLLARLQTQAQPAALLLIDIDQFRLINDNCGCIAGDELLRSFAETVAGLLQRSDFFARLGGDQFAVLAEGRSAEQALALGRMVHEQLRDFSFEWEGRQFRLQATVAVVPLTAEVVSFDQAMLMADETLYLAKQQGHGQLRLHGSADASDPGRERINWALVLLDALKNQLLRAHFQCLQPMRPELAETGLRIETLMRLWDPQRQQLVLPTVFIPPAERFHMIVALDRWMLGEVIGFLGQHPELCQQLAMVTVNLSAVSMRDATLANQIEALLEQHQVPPRLICLEITETEAIVNFGAAQAFVRQLHDCGCRFALDDFGSGFASFRYLHELDFDSLKIDGSFVRDMDQEPSRSAMVRSMVDMARHLGKPVVAEWVETEAVAQQLVAMGVDWTQGFLFHHPEALSAAALQAQITQSRERALAWHQGHDVDDAD